MANSFLRGASPRRALATGGHVRKGGKIGRQLGFDRLEERRVMAVDINIDFVPPSPTEFITGEPYAMRVVPGTALPNGDGDVMIEWSLFLDDGDEFQFEAEELVEPSVTLEPHEEFTFSVSEDGFYIVQAIAHETNADDVSTDSGFLPFSGGGGGTDLVAIFPATLDPVEEGTLVTETGSATGGSGSYTFSWEVYKSPEFVTPYAEGTGAEVSFTPDDNSTYQVLFTVNDGETLPSAAAGTLEVSNVAPTLDSITGPDDVVAGESADFTLGITDLGAADTFTSNWELYDSGNNLVNSGSGDDEIAVPINAIGNLTLSVTVSDDDNGESNVVTKSLFASGSVQNGGTVLVGATNEGSEIDVDSAPGGITVTVDGNAVTYTGVTQVTIFGQAGDDVILVDSSVTTSVMILGGAGANIMQGGGGNDVIVGGSDGDVALGGAGRDLVIGGSSSDLLTGGAGDDILIGGTTDYDASAAALASLAADWQGTGTFAARVALLSALLNSTTVQDDNEIDIMIGGGGSDWFFANLSDPNFFDRDFVLDMTVAERVRYVEL